MPRWIGGSLLCLLLFGANYAVFQSLIQPAPAPAAVPAGAQGVLAEPPRVHRTALNLKALAALKKREHIRTLVFQNFRGIPLRERAKLFDVIYNQSREMGIDPYLTLSIIATESSFRTRAISWAGAYGLMQIKPITAEEVARDLGIPWRGRETLFDPVVNITLGLRYLAKLKARFGNIADALNAYNYGPQYVVSCRRADKRLPDRYLRKIRRNLQRYGLEASSLVDWENTA